MISALIKWPLEHRFLVLCGPLLLFGWVYQYYLKDESGRQDLGSLRALQDYFVRYQLAAVPGVSEVASIGGFVRQWQVEVSSLRMKQRGIALQEVFDAIARNNLNVG